MFPLFSFASATVCDSPRSLISSQRTPQRWAHFICLQRRCNVCGAMVCRVKELLAVEKKYGGFVSDADLDGVEMKVRLSLRPRVTCSPSA